MKNSIIKKTSKKLIIKQAGLKEKVKAVKIDNLSLQLRKEDLPFQSRSRAYVYVSYFKQHKPIEGKVYQCKAIANNSSTPYIGIDTRAALLFSFTQFKKIEAVSVKPENKKLFSAFKFVK